jgi:hypothetical protein
VLESAEGKVPVGEGFGRGVDVASDKGVAVEVESGVEVADGLGDGGGVAVESLEADVPLGEGSGGGVDVTSLDVEVPVGDGEAVEVSEIGAAVGEKIAGPGICVIVITRSENKVVEGLRIKNKNSITRMIVTINLKRS